MKASTAYRRAARFELEKYWGGFDALMDAYSDHGRGLTLVSEFNHAFTLWCDFQDDREAGCLALCLMADVLESEGK